MTSQDSHAKLNIYSNLELHLDYYETSVYKNQYKTTFQNGGYIECSLSYPKATVEPNLTIFDNGNKYDYQTNELFLFSTKNKTTIEEIIPEEEEPLIQAILHDTRFASQFHKYISIKNNAAGILVIKHVPITNGQNPLYVIFVLQKREQTSPGSINKINNIDEMVSHSVQTSDSTPFASYQPPLTFSLNSIIYSSPFINNKKNKTEHFTIDDFVVNKSKNVYLMINYLCDINVSSLERTIKEGLAILGKNRKGETGMAIDASFGGIIDERGEIIPDASGTIPGIIDSYAIGNSENKIICDYITPDEDKTEFYKRNYSSNKINIAGYVSIIIIIFICLFLFCFFKRDVLSGILQKIKDFFVIYYVEAEYTIIFIGTVLLVILGILNILSWYVVIALLGFGGLFATSWSIDYANNWKKKHQLLKQKDIQR